MQVKIYRYDPSADTAGHFDTFDVPAMPHWTVMDVLDYISENVDSTIAYFKHGACDHGICGRCALHVNGKVKLACSTEISEEQVLEIRPVNDNVLRDLVVIPKIQ
ncbi:MAG: 2Fe-2S iron-sulfur cluster-binding protein [Bacillota bacterium]|nr:2Fe-2S iron-sulfur cluster-binding protein [Bacillota bacterium]